jgi:preprotein translocase subunit SecE
MLGVRVPPGLPKKRSSGSELNKFIKFLKEIQGELRKVTWPTKDELIGSTIVTIVVSLVVALFIGVVDRIFVLIINSIFGGGIGS